jgi:hypothetical protein
MNSSALKHEYAKQNISEISDLDVAESENAAETVVQMKTRQQLIAKQCEEACHISGNASGPDLAFFEEKYGICAFV